MTGAHLGAATDTDRGWLVAQTGSLLFRRMVFGRWPDCQSATQQTVIRAHLGTATVAQTGSLLSRGLAIRPPAEYHSAKQQTASLRYKPASIRIGGSAKMRARHLSSKKTCCQTPAVSLSM